MHKQADYKVGELASITGKSVRALRLYEELGLLEPAHRTKGRFRMYGAEAVARVDWISKMQTLGFTLVKIKELNDLRENGEMGGVIMTEIRSVYESKLKETRLSIRKLQELEHELGESLRFLQTCQGCHATGLPHACETQCDHPQRHDVPMLVKGLNAQEIHYTTISVKTNHTSNNTQTHRLHEDNGAS